MMGISRPPGEPHIPPGQGQQGHPVDMPPGPHNNSPNVTTQEPVGVPAPKGPPSDGGKPGDGQGGGIPDPRHFPNENGPPIGDPDLPETPDGAPEGPKPKPIPKPTQEPPPKPSDTQNQQQPKPGDQGQPTPSDKGQPTQSDQGQPTQSDEGQPTQGDQGTPTESDQGQPSQGDDDQTPAQGEDGDPSQGGEDSQGGNEPGDKKQDPTKSQSDCGGEPTVLEQIGAAVKGAIKGIIGGLVIAGILALLPEAAAGYAMLALGGLGVLGILGMLARGGPGSRLGTIEFLSELLAGGVTTHLATAPIREAAGPIRQAIGEIIEGMKPPVKPPPIEGPGGPSSGEPTSSGPKPKPEGEGEPSSGGGKPQPSGEIVPKRSTLVDDDLIPSKYKDDPRWNDLKADPDHNGNVTSTSRAEAMAGLEAESRGTLDGPISRGPKSTDLLDGNRNPWNVKAPQSPNPGDSFPFEPDVAGNAIRKALNRPITVDGVSKAQSVLLDETFMNAADRAALWDWINSNLTPEQISRIKTVSYGL